MRTTERTHPSAGAFTVVELLMIMSVLAIAAVVFLNLFARPRKSGAPRISCVNNLKQVALGYRIWAIDHGDRFPWEVSRKEGGILPEGVSPGTVFGDLVEAYRCLSNELTVPKILVCPMDKARVRAKSFDSGDPNRFGGPGMLNSTSNLTYFAGWDAKDDWGQMPLAGDPDFSSALATLPATAGPGALVKSVGVATPLATTVMEPGVGWESTLHEKGGNLAMGDGAVHQLNSTQLQEALARAAAATNTLRIRLVFPK